MRCEKCGALITSVKTSRFLFDGSDFVTTFGIEEDDRCNAVIMETDSEWTGYGLTEKEMQERLQCPYCKQFPFTNDEIQVHEVVRIICFKQEQNDGERGMTNREYLSTLDSRSFTEWVLYDAPEIGRMGINSPVFLAEWLEKEYDGWINLREYGAVIASRLVEGELICRNT
jgi:hypothetical protein